MKNIAPQIERVVPRIMEDISSVEKDRPLKIIPAIMKKGIDNINLSMFNEELRRRLLNATGDEYFKRGFIVEAIKAFTLTGNSQKLIEVGDHMVNTSMYSHATDAYSAGNSKDKLLWLGERCLKEGHFNEAIRTFKLVNDSYLIRKRQNTQLKYLSLSEIRIN